MRFVRDLVDRLTGVCPRRPLQPGRLCDTAILFDLSAIFALLVTIPIVVEVLTVASTCCWVRWLPEPLATHFSASSAVKEPSILH